MLTKDKACILFFSLVFLAGCASLGPKTISRDRPEYDDHLAESWKKQMLLNIVKLRYADLPTFLDVSSIIAQYGIEQQVNADVSAGWPAAANSNSAGVGGYYRYSDKPTITYTPLSGQKFTKNLLTPIPPMGIVSMIQSGWPADMIFSICVKSINNQTNYSARDNSKKHDAFLRLITLWRELQADDVVDFRVETSDEKEGLVFIVTPNELTEATKAKLEAIRQILGVKAGSDKYTVVFGKLASSDTEIALLTRSVLEIMIEISYLVEVPPDHIRKKFVREWGISGLQDMPLVRIRSGQERPEAAFVAIRYHDYWFWIDDSDFSSKRNLTLLMIFLSLTETDQKAGAGPIVTI
jgi:hypothetical protein